MIQACSLCGLEGLGGGKGGWGGQNRNERALPAAGTVRNGRGEGVNADVSAAAAELGQVHMAERVHLFVCSECSVSVCGGEEEEEEDRKLDGREKAETAAAAAGSGETETVQH